MNERKFNDYGEMNQGDQAEAKTTENKKGFLTALRRGIDTISLLYKDRTRVGGIRSVFHAVFGGVKPEEVHTSLNDLASRLKNAEPIKVDESGNIIPLDKTASAEQIKE